MKPLLILAAFALADDKALVKTPTLTSKDAASHDGISDMVLTVIEACEKAENLDLKVVLDRDSTSLGFKLYPVTTAGSAIKDEKDQNIDIKTSTEDIAKGTFTGIKYSTSVKEKANYIIPLKLISPHLKMKKFHDVSLKLEKKCVSDKEAVEPETSPLKVNSAMSNSLLMSALVASFASLYAGLN